MFGNNGGTNNFSDMSSSTFQGHGPRGPQEGGTPPDMENADDASQGSQGFGTPPGLGNSGEGPQDHLGVFAAVDSDSDSTISESEFNTLADGILEVTGTEVTSSFTEFDTDGDSLLSTAELGAVLEGAGFAPPPPFEQGMGFDDSQGGEFAGEPAGGQDMMVQLLGYLQPQAGDIDIIV